MFDILGLSNKKEKIQTRKKVISVCAMVMAGSTILLSANVVSAEPSATPNEGFVSTMNNEEEIEPMWLFERKYEVTGDDVNIRTGPGTSYKSVGMLYRHDVISVKSIDNGWAKFKYNGQWRYVSATYIKEV